MHRSESGLLSTIVLEMGGSSDLCARLRPLGYTVLPLQRRSAAEPGIAWSTSAMLTLPSRS